MLEKKNEWVMDDKSGDDDTRNDRGKEMNQE